MYNNWSYMSAFNELTEPNAPDGCNNVGGLYVTYEKYNIL